MKKLFFVLLFVAALNFSAKAQAPQVPEKSPEQRANHLTKVLSKALNLSADQSAKINAILLTRATEMDSLKSNPPANKKGTHLDKEKITLTADEQVMGVLNPDQQKQYLQWEADQKQKHQGKKGGADPEQEPQPENPAPPANPPAQG